MEEKILKIVIARLRKYGSEPINTEKLVEIRSDVFKATKTNKFASFSNVKKWVKAARNEMRKSAKPSRAAPAPSKKAPHKAERISSKSSIDDFVAPPVSRKIEDSVNLIKGEAVPLQEVSLTKPTIMFDKVYLQSIKFEIAGIRQTMERVSRQLDRLEKELSSHGKED